MTTHRKAIIFKDCFLLSWYMIHQINSSYKKNIKIQNLDDPCDRIHFFRFIVFHQQKSFKAISIMIASMVPLRGIEPRVHPYHGRVLPLYYSGKLTIFDSHLIHDIISQLVNPLYYNSLHLFFQLEMHLLTEFHILRLYQSILLSQYNL